MKFRVQVSILEKTDNPVINTAIDQIREKVLRELWRRARIRHYEAKLHQDSVEFPFNYWFIVNEDDIKDMCFNVVDYVDKYIKANNINGDIYEYEVPESEYEDSGKLCDIGTYVINGNNVTYAELMLTDQLQGDYSVIELKRKIVNMAFDSLPSDRNDLVKIIEKLAETEQGIYDVLIKKGKVYIMPVD